jgi:hypothetical protein
MWVAFRISQGAIYYRVTLAFHRNQVCLCSGFSYYVPNLEGALSYCLSIPGNAGLPQEPLGSSYILIRVILDMLEYLI